jgi:hypothetical protein
LAKAGFLASLSAVAEEFINLQTQLRFDIAHVQFHQPVCGSRPSQKMNPSTLPISDARPIPMTNPAKIRQNPPNRSTKGWHEVAAGGLHKALQQSPGGQKMLGLRVDRQKWPGGWDWMASQGKMDRQLTVQLAFDYGSTGPQNMEPPRRRAKESRVWYIFCFLRQFE